MTPPEAARQRLILELGWCAGTLAKTTGDTSYAERFLGRADQASIEEMRAAIAEMRAKLKRIA